MPGKRIAIVQSSYIPWKGYFDLIRSVDAFILMDNVQFTRRDWRSRNKIKTYHGVAWLSIPVHTRGRYTQLIEETTTSDPDWGRRHWQTIRANYAKAPYFDRYADRVAALYRNPPERLSEINHAFLTAICDMLGITTPMTWSNQYEARETPSERLVDLCLAVGATRYLSGPNAKDYLDIAAFDAAGIAVEFADYSGYPEYPQPHGPFEHHVSVVDLLFCTGPRALAFMKTL